jgi:hypothetical protein
LFLSEHYELTLAVLLLYLGLLDGFLKLESGSNLATLGRDAVLYAIVLGAVVRMILRKTPLIVPPFTGIVVVWVAVCVVQLANPADHSILHSIAALRQHLEFVPLFFFGYFVMRSERRLTVLFVLLVVVAAANGIASLAQWQLTPSQLSSWGPGYANLIHGVATSRGFIDAKGIAHVRPPALGSDMGFGGVVGMLALPGMIALLINVRMLKRYAWFVLAASPLVILAVWTSQARVSVVGAVVALVALVLLTVTSRRGLAIAVVIGLLGLAASLTVGVVSGGSGPGTGPVTRYQSITPSRVISTTIKYRQGTLALIPTYFTRYPLGAGIGSTGPAAGSGIGGTNSSSPLDAESEFTFLLVETGIPGLLVMLGLTLTVVAIGVRLRVTADTNLQRLLMALVAVLVAIAVLWIAGITTASTPSAPIFWLAAGTLAYWYGELRAGRLKPRRNRVGAALASR